MKKGKFAASVITTGLLVASLGMAAFAQSPTDGQTATQTEDQQDAGQRSDQGRRQRPDRSSGDRGS